MVLTFTGDWAPTRPLDTLPEIAKGQSGSRIGNLECAFSDSIVKSGKAYTSVLPCASMENVGTGCFAALSVANNHVNDAGNFDCFYETLTQSFPDIQFFGTVDKPFAMFSSSNDSGARTYVIGCLEPCRSRSDRIFRMEDVENLIRKLRKEVNISSRDPVGGGSDYVRIYVYPHWGKEGEYTRYPAPWQLKLARRWIDVGADGVFGSHSHVPQGRETYKGKPIYYSLGNFDFDHPESKFYSGTSDRMTVTVDGGTCEERYNSEEARLAVECASKELEGWSLWRWARKVGAFNLRKNEASWRIRLKQSFIKTFPKYLVWQFLPQILLFRVARLWH